MTSHVRQLLLLALASACAGAATPLRREAVGSNRSSETQDTRGGALLEGEVCRIQYDSAMSGGVFGISFLPEGKITWDNPRRFEDGVTYRQIRRSFVIELPDKGGGNEELRGTLSDDGTRLEGTMVVGFPTQWSGTCRKSTSN